MKVKASYNEWDDIRRVILGLRGITDDFEAALFIAGGEYERNIASDASLEAIRQEALQSITHGRKILVYGDYDADGICATAIMKLYLSAADYHIPERAQGYGLTPEAAAHIKEDIDTVITVDCGIRSKEAVRRLVDRGKTVIVTDHHEPNVNEVPICIVVHPKLYDTPFSGYSGSGVAYKVMSSIFGPSRKALQLAAIGTIADMMPMLDENRLLVRRGMDSIRNEPIPGVRALAEVAAKPLEHLTETDISFYIAPMINACGRRNNANLAARLIMEENYDKAIVLARQVGELNTERKQATKTLSVIAEDSVVYSGNAIIAVIKDEVDGMIGLIANDLHNKHKKPAIVFCAKGNVYSGSCRGGDLFDCDCLLKSVSRLILSGGGHKGAAGMSVKADKLRELIDAIIEYAEHRPLAVSGEFLADIEIDSRLVYGIINGVDALRPYGQKFETPVFVTTMYPDEIKSVGKEKAHTRIVKDNIDYMFFGVSHVEAKAFKDQAMRVAFELGSAYNPFTKRPSVIARKWEILR